MAAPASTVDFLACLRKSAIIKGEVLAQTLEKVGDPPTDPVALANLFVREGLLTKFQAKLLLSGRYRGFRIGPYLVKDQLGQGGMGVVYLGEHDALRREVAIKVLTPSGSNDRLSVERFLREARAAAALDHPNIVRIHDVTKQGDAQCLIMEYVDGETLDSVLERAGPLPCGRAVGYVTQAAAGLQHAYEKGFVHRDIKPGNLMLARDGTVKILDMGLARSCTDDDDKLTAQHDAGAIVGTADFIAPEQALNLPDIDVRADIYSLGATFFALVTGRPPFDGNTTQKLMQHQMKEAPTLTSVDKTFPPGLASVVARMMAKRPEDRFQTPAEVIGALSPWLSALGSAKVIAGISNTDMASGVDLQNTISELAMGGTKRMLPAQMPRKRNNKLVIGGILGGLALFTVMVLAAAWLGGYRGEAAGPRTSATAWSPTQPAPPAPQPVPPPAPKAAPKAAPKSAPKSEPVLYKFDAKVIPACSFTLTGSKVTAGKRPTLPAGYNLTCWKPESVGEFTRTDVDGRPALGLTSRSTDPSAQLTVELEMTALGVNLAAGKSYRVRVEYMTRGDAAGAVTVQDPNDGYKILGTAPFAKTDGAWKTVTAQFVRPAGPVRLSVDAGRSADSGMLFVRTIEVFGQAGTPPAATAAGGVLFRLAAADVPPFRNTKEGSNHTGGSRESLPRGIYFHGWKQDTAGEYFCETVDGAKALGWSHVSGPTSGQIGIEVEGTPHSLNVDLTEGQTYTHKLTYKTLGGAHGGTYAQTQGTYQEVPGGRADLPDTGGQWKTVEVTWVRPANPIRILVDNYSPSPGAVMYVREVVVLGGGQSSAVPSAPAAPPRAEGGAAFTWSAAGLTPFRHTFADGMTDANFGQLIPTGLWAHCWKKTSVAEFRGEVAAGSAAVGVTNLNDDLSSQFLFQVETTGPGLRVGQEYRAKVEYRTANDAHGSLCVRDPAFQSIATAELPGTGGEWRTAHVSFRRAEQKLDAMVDNKTVGEGNTLFVRKFEVVELK